MVDTPQSFKVKRFFKLLNFLADSKTVLALICVQQNNISLENYPFYGFIRDVISLLIAEGNLIAKDKKLLTEAEKSVPTDYDNFGDLLSKLEKEKLEQLTFSQTDDEWGDLPKEELERRVSKMAEKTNQKAVAKKKKIVAKKTPNHLEAADVKKETV